VRVTGNKCTLIGNEGSSPPLPHIEVSASEGKALIGLGHAIEVKGGASADPEPKADSAPATKAEAKAKALADDRAQLIADALHLVEPEGLETEGEREGKPTVAAIEAITDLSDVTAEEIDVALAAHETADA
jgi:hypothetical protein